MSAQNDASFLRMFALVLGALIIFTVIIIFAANLVGGDTDEAKQGDTAMRDAAVAERIKPVGSIALGPATTAEPVVAEPREPSKVYQDVCFACHGTGAAGAPKVGDSGAWAARAAAGMESLMNNAINGKGAMPPRGGNPTVTDDELRGTIQLMLEKTGLQAN